MILTNKVIPRVLWGKKFQYQPNKALTNQHCIQDQLEYAIETVEFISNLHIKRSGKRWQLRLKIIGL